MGQVSKKVLSAVIASQLVLGAAWGASAAMASGAESADKFSNTYTLNKIASYSAGAQNEDGGVAEIVKYNKDNGKFYLVNGSSNPPSLDIVSLVGGSGELKKDKTVLVKTLAETNDFKLGDLTSVAVDTNKDLVYVAVQEAAANKAGKILALNYEGKLVAEYAAGVQPDMIAVTADGEYVLTADEAEPRTGVSGEDPKGSVTIVNTSSGKSVQVYFDNPAVIADDVHIRGAADKDGVIATRGTKADALYDLEPEYITIAEDGKTAYVALQENNAIAAIDIAKAKVLSVKSLGLKDYNDPRNALDLRKDGEIKFENVPFYGVYMPDGIASYTVDGKTYLLTANEGDATEWPNRTNASKVKKLKGKLNPTSELYAFLQGTNDYDDVEAMTDRGNDRIYMYGGRSFSIYEADSMKQVYDSGSDFEQVTAQRLPDYFNTSSNKAKLDDRSTKKGPEPEDVKTGVIDGRTFAFIGLERIGGIMMYDVTNPRKPEFASYVNTREFVNGKGEVKLDTDTSPEGLEFIPASDSPTGKPLLLAAFEVGGKVAVYEIAEAVQAPAVSFTDIEGSFAKEEIAALAEQGILQGVGKDKFGPKAGMSRADFTLLLSRIVKAELEPIQQSRFADIAPTDYYAAAVEWAAAAGIAEGGGNGQFHPESDITREQMAVMLVRLAEALEIKLPAIHTAVSFADESLIGAYAKEAVAAAQQGGVIGGKPNADGTGVSFDPQGKATREQIAKMIAGFLDILIPR